MALKILLADANVAAQNTGKKILSAAGHDVITVSNGVAALKKIAETHPDIVLLDVYMPGSTGVDVCAKVKAASDLAQIRVVLTAGQMEPFNAGEATRIKADGLITKPFDVANLVTVVERFAAGIEAAGGTPEKTTGASHSAKPAAPQTRAERKSPERRQGGEVCDVCGHVNRDAATVCERCDVPLPSSVIIQ